MAKLSSYAAVSAMCLFGILYHAVRTRRQFYPVMFYLAHSKISMVLLVNMVFVTMYSIWQLTNTVFLGLLRETEVEQLNEQCWREAMEILFAMTVFRDEFDLQFVFFVAVLLFMKAYHWLAQKRVEYIETTPFVSRLSHVRLCTFMALLLTLDCLFFHRSFSHLLKTRQASVSLFFAFEYMILVITTAATIMKYALYLREMAYEGRWTEKAVCIYYLQLVQDLLHLSIYLLFFLVIFMHYGLPLHLVRELYETFKNLKNRIAEFIRYRRLTSNMNECFPDASADEISRDATCIVCREEMAGAKRLPCGHLFHVHCLRSWLERQHTCPTCRAPMNVSEESAADEDMAPEIHPYEDENDFMTDDDASTGQELMADNFDVSPSSNVGQLHPAAQTAAAQYTQPFVFPTFTTGGSILYPMFIPVPPQQEVGELGSSTAANEAMLDSHPILQWAWMPVVAQPQLAGRPSCQQVRVAGVTHERLDGMKFSNITSESFTASVCWIPAHLDVSRHDEQLSYLRQVAKILRNQLQSTVELEDQLIFMTKELEAVSESGDSGDIHQHCRDGDNLSNLQTTKQDTKGKAPMYDAKDHC